MNQPATTRFGVTLPEVVIVLGVLTLLLSLMLFAIHAARTSSRRVQDSHNMQQTGIALHIHESHFQRLPCSYNAFADPESNWVGAVMTCVSDSYWRDYIDHSRPLEERANLQAASRYCPSMLRSSAQSPAAIVSVTSWDDRASSVDVLMGSMKFNRLVAGEPLGTSSTANKVLLIADASAGAWSLAPEMDVDDRNVSEWRMDTLVVLANGAVVRTVASR